jgi:hypothetical protein
MYSFASEVDAFTLLKWREAEVSEECNWKALTDRLLLFKYFVTIFLFSKYLKMLLSLKLA